MYLRANNTYMWVMLEQSTDNRMTLEQEILELHSNMELV